MPRPRKAGLDYFPEDVNRRNDFKIMDLLNEYGPLGYTIYDFCLQYIYANGYYLDVPMSQLILLLTKDIGAKWVKNKDLVLQVIHYCAEIGLFDHALLQQNVITSVGIQRRYNEVTVRNKADKTKYWLLDKNNEKNGSAVVSVSDYPQNVADYPQNVADCPQNVAKTQQIKEKESKGNKRKDIASPDDESSNEAEEIFISIPLNDNTKYDVPVLDVQHYKKLYPAVDVEQELRGMCGWCEANSRNRKTRNGIKRFINGWLNKAQNQGGKGYGFHQGHSGGAGNTGSSGYTNPNVL